VAVWAPQASPPTKLIFAFSKLDVLYKRKVFKHYEDEEKDNGRVYPRRGYEGL